MGIHHNSTLLTLMTTLRSLGLAGVRSYAPGDLQEIQFFRPLTVIVGKNGSGKTVGAPRQLPLKFQTIIEALKFISTGSTPPLAEKHGFVHDPKVRIGSVLLTISWLACHM